MSLFTSNIPFIIKLFSPSACTGLMSLGDMGNALGNLGNYYALIPPLIVGLRLAGQIAPVQEILLLRQLMPDSDPTSSYSLTHTRLQTHFHTRATQGDELARIEEAYHALALGNPEPAIQTGIDAQNPHPTL